MTLTLDRLLIRRLKQGPQRVARKLLELPGRIFKFKSLKLKLMTASLTIAAMILLVTYVTLSSSARRVAAEQAEQHVKELLLYFSGMVAESVAADDRLQVEFLGRALLTRGIRAVCITGSSGKVLYSSQPNLEQEEVFSSPDVRPYAGGILGTSDADGHSLLQGAAPIRSGSTPVGMIHVWMNCTDLEGEIQEVKRK